MNGPVRSLSLQPFLPGQRDSFEADVDCVVRRMTVGRSRHRPVFGGLAQYSDWYLVGFRGAGELRVRHGDAFCLDSLGCRGSLSRWVRYTNNSLFSRHSESAWRSTKATLAGDGDILDCRFRGSMELMRTLATIFIFVKFSSL
jgi:hypothetical protein